MQDIIYTGIRLLILYVSLVDTFFHSQQNILGMYLSKRGEVGPSLEMALKYLYFFSCNVVLSEVIPVP